MRPFSFIASIVAACALTGCASMTGGSGAVDVTRFHLAGADGTIERGTIAIDTLANSPIDAQSLEFRSYADAVTAELARTGYTPVAGDTPADFVARVNYRRGPRIAPETRSPISVGIGGSTGSYGSGVGVGVGISGGGKPRATVFTELSVSIERRADASVIWEGRADTEAREDRAAAGADPIANKLAVALFRGFPGESGRTITVP